MTAPAITGTRGGAAVGRALLPMVAALMLIAVAGTGAIFLLADADRYAQVATLVQSPTGLAVLFVAGVLCNATLILPVPGMALTGVAALVVNPLLVGIVAGAGQTIGELTGYLAGRTGRAMLPERPWLDRVRAWMDRHGSATLFVLALVPNPAFDVAGVLAGVLRMPVLRYLAVAGAGKVARNILFAYAVVAGIGWLAGLLGGG